MTLPGLQLRQLVFSGPNVEDASASFGPGLNVLWGTSDTGKSFILDSVDYMLGGRGPLRDIPERVGYNRVRLQLATLAGEEFTLERGPDGGPFKAYSHNAVTGLIDETTAVPLAEAHREGREDNLSSFLLQKLSLTGRRIKKNKRNDTQSLSFRNLARLIIVNEDEIHQQRSPLSDGNYTADTANTSVFKLLLTGVDDEHLDRVRVSSPELQTRGAQLDLLDQLIRDYTEQAKGLAGTHNELDEQLGRLESTLARQQEQLSITEAQYRKASDDRRDRIRRIEESTNRLTEISVLIERFGLLEEHYSSDTDRLRGIEEAGSLFAVLGEAVCPLCGAPPEHHRKHGDCDGDVDAVVEAAQAEILKIEIRQRELVATIDSLKKEAASFEKRLPSLRQEMHEVSQQIETIISPNLRKVRTAFSELADKRSDVREGLVIYRNIDDLKQRKATLEREDEAGGTPTNASDVDLSTSTVDQFSLTILKLLKAWNFPEIDRAHFDLKLRDLVINGKQRTSFGKGLRAVSQAAFSIGLLEYCRSNETPHPGFVMLDSPLLSYREPDIEPEVRVEDDLRGTDLKPRFYDYLKGYTSDKQVIIIENTDPPDDVQTLPNTLRFTRSESSRFGFFPVKKRPSPDAPNEDNSASL